jgi:NAD(P)-dependent dehydrogenase (short-subunit alcohol dehydrogenase family)
VNAICPGWVETDMATRRYREIGISAEAAAAGVPIGREGMSVLSQARAADGTPAWVRATGAGPVDQDAVDTYIARQVTRDPDLWVLEFESPDLLPPFEGRIL